MSPRHYHKQMLNPSFAPEYARNSDTHQKAREIEEKVEHFFERIKKWILRRK